MSKILLVGKPNAGKSSLFNRLTGLNQKVGNFSGVTVDRKIGKYLDLDIVDIPGLQSLVTYSPEEVISRKSILEEGEGNALIFVANGMQLMDSLMLFSQVADLQLPSMFVINFSDELEENNIKIDVQQLTSRLSCQVLLVNSKNGEGIETLKKAISNNKFVVPNAFCLSLYESVENGLISNNYREQILSNQNFEKRELDYNRRKQMIVNILTDIIVGQDDKSGYERSRKWDRILLHPVYGLVLFLLVLFGLFQALFFVSSYPMDWIDSSFAFLSEQSVNYINIPWLSDLVANAVIPGLGGVLIFVPQIMILFLLIGVLEQIGYLSRISYLSDAFLKKFGLSGHSVVPLVSGWACAIPAIMSTRIIGDPKERLAVILASPLMTCSARLPVYTILISVLVPENNAFWGLKGLFLLALYILGTLATLVVSYLSNKYLKVQSNSNWALELPVFRKPDWKGVFLHSYQKTKSFVVSAGKIIFVISIILWAFASFSPLTEEELKSKTHEEDRTEESIRLEYSYLGYAGKSIEPVIRPLGYDWKIGIALLSSFVAREVFVGTISTLYSIDSSEDESIVSKLKAEKDTAGNPIFSVATSVSLLIFYVFAMQCMSTLAIVKKETGKWKYVIGQFTFLLIVAYLASFCVYQALS